MKYKMFVADYDGTLGEAPNYISEENVKAINEYENAGGKFLVCTGREFGSIRNILNKYGIKGDIICCQGALIGDAQTGKVKQSYGMDKTDCVEIINWLVDKIGDNVAMVVTSNGLYINKQNKYTDYYQHLTSLEGKLAPDLAKTVMESNFEVYKIMVICDVSYSLEIIDDFNAKKSKYVANSGAKGLVEIINPVNNKGRALKTYAESLGVSPEEIITVGDSTNDLSLMEYGFYGVAVGDGNDKLKAKAKEVTVPFKDDPVAYLIRKYCL